MKPLPSETIRLLSSSQVITSVLNVVKELLENSLDAGAASVDVKLENYGLDRIEVRDNGCGIKAEDAPVMAVMHYTSKISSHQDLEHLETYGFRGEALGSICAVAEVVLTTKTADQDISTQYTLDLTGKVISQKPSHLGQGTTVCVMKLFRNLPVRRQFYSNTKKCKEKLKKVQDLLMAYAIIKPELRVTFTHNKAVVWQKPRVSDHRRALLAALGTVPTANLLPLQHRHQQPQIAIDGYFPKPGSDASVMSSSNSDRTFIFVNDRPIHHKDILKVVRQQYSSQHTGDSTRYPTMMMSITIPASAIDVNLTPDKTQVMLHDKEAVLSVVEAMLMKLYGSETNSESAPPDDAMPPGSRNPSVQVSVVDENGGTVPATESVITQQNTTLTEPSSCCAEVPPPGRPDLSSTMHSEPACESSLNHSANTSSSSSLEDWVINKSLCELDTNLPLVNEDVLFTCAGLTDQATPAGPGSLEDLGSGVAGISAESWSTGRAFRDSDIGEPLEPVKIHQSAESVRETEMESKKSPCKKTLSNAVTEKMTKLTAYDLISNRAVRQPMSASAIFQQEVRPTILLENPKASLKEVTLAMEEQWKNLKEEDRQKYEERAEKDASRYDLQSKRVSERGARPAEQERRSPALKRKAPLSNQSILDQLFSSQPARKRSPAKPSRRLPFSLAALRGRLGLPSWENGPDPQPLRLVERLPSHGAWVVTCGGKLSLFSPSRVEEALLFNQLLERNVLPTAPLEAPILLTDGVLGGEEYTSALCSMEKESPGTSGETYFSDPRLLSNGFQIRLTAGSASAESRLEVTGIADGVPFLGVADLKEILTAVVERNATSVRETRPLKVISYLQGEAVRQIRRLPLSLSAEEVTDTLSRMEEQLGAGSQTCIHGRPFFHHLIDIPKAKQDALQILSNTP
ncbi:PMS1 protein homolog 1 [Conger conger]|uniref:PMS1 protein homolog 1 n=1 Tax=Conger conger TaxID=82655 RepID=UPI002A59FD23|nr:PMS1 protein homolog 1 [Conger conger]